MPEPFPFHHLDRVISGKAFREQISGKQRLHLLPPHEWPWFSR